MDMITLISLVTLGISVIGIFCCGSWFMSNHSTRLLAVEKRDNRLHNRVDDHNDKIHSIEKLVERNATENKNLRLEVSRLSQDIRDTNNILREKWCVK